MGLAISSDGALKVGDLKRHNLVAGKLYEAAVVWLQTALVNWGSHPLQPVGRQRRTFAGDVVPDVPEIEDGWCHNTHPLPHNLRVHIVVASPHPDNQVEERVWWQHQAAVEGHDEATLAVHVHNAGLIHGKVVDEAAPPAVRKVRYLDFLVLLKLEVQVELLLEEIVPDGIHDGTGALRSKVPSSQGVT